MPPLENRLVLHRFICREFGRHGMRTMLKRLRDVLDGFDAGGVREYAHTLSLSHTALARVEGLDEYDATEDHALKALKQPNETWIAMIIEPVFREFMLKEED